MSMLRSEEMSAPMTADEALTHKAESMFMGKAYADRAFRERRWSNRPAHLKDDFREAAKAQRQAGYDVEY